jgi:hypothetical protein
MNEIEQLVFNPSDPVRMATAPFRWQGDPGVQNWLNGLYQQGFTDAANATPGTLPTISSLSPSTLAHGAGAFTLTVTGTGFQSGCIVCWGGANRTSTYLSATQATAKILASDIAAAGSVNVTVLNPDRGLSAASVFTIS